MIILFVRWSAIAFMLGLFMTLSPGCVVSGDGYGYGYGGSVDIGVDYYEPFGVYGGWGPGYRVGPFRDGGHRLSHGGGHPRPHTYKAPPASHSIPSIPSRSRSGRSRSY